MVRWVGIALLLVLSVASAWLLERLERLAPETEQPLRHDPDYYMEDFAQLSMDAEGRPDRRVLARLLLHYPDDDSTELVAPRLELYNGSDPPWYVVAERGWVSADNEVILLYGPVEIWRNDATGARDLEVLTRDLRILTDEDYAESDHPTTVRGPTTETRGVGMRARFDAGELELLDAVRTRADPPTGG